MQIAFLTLFLGLISGTIDVRLNVQGPVAAVELRLDGERVARLERAPWSAAVDLGSGLEPRLLEARALDRNGAVVASARQWLNLPRPAAEVQIAIERGPDGPPAARLSWESIVGQEPEVAVTLDGVPLPVEEGRAALPALEPGSTHLLSAEVRFPEGVTARRDLVLGGEWSDEISTELTAVPVRVPKGWSQPPAGRLAGWFQEDGRPLAAVAVDRGPAQVVMVRDLEPAEAMHALGPLQLNGLNTRAGGSTAELREVPIPHDTRVRIMWPTGRATKGQVVPAQNFHATFDFSSRWGGFHGLLTRVAYPHPVAGPRRFADAVAVAGLQAAASNRRRAVVLVLGEGWAADASRFEVVTVRRYLESVGVPLHVWSLVEPAKLPPAAAAWGEVQEVSSLALLRRAVERLDEDLETQRIVWLDGRHLPQAVTLTPQAPVARVIR